MSNKRREIEEDSSGDSLSHYDPELQPILKKLKSTHIDAGVGSTSLSLASRGTFQQDSPQNLINMSTLHRTVDGSQNVSSSYNGDDKMDITYKPELDETANPFYYSPNKILHDAFVERIRREKS